MKRGLDHRYVIALLMAALPACSPTLPDDLSGYESRCIKMNVDPIAAHADDPHNGRKNVYACGVDLQSLSENKRPFPAGTIVIKESRRTGEDFVWLIATARKSGSGWAWEEYTRNFADEEFRKILAGQNICVDCHRKVETADWIYTGFTPR